MDNWTIARMISESTGQDLESAYHNVTLRRIRDNVQPLNKSPLPPVPGPHGFGMRKSKEVSMPPSAMPGNADVREFLQEAQSAGMDRNEAIKAICRESGRSYESVLQESMMPEVSRLDRERPGLSAPSRVPSLGSLAVNPVNRERSPDTQNRTDLDDRARRAPARMSADAGRELLAIVNDTDKRDSVREDALRELITGGALDELYALVNNPDRCDCWREQALHEIIRGEDVRLLELIVNNTDRCNSWREEALSALCRLASRSAAAADCLYRLVNNTDRCDSWRYQALRFLIQYRCREHLRRIADNTDRCGSWRREAREALGE